MARSKIIKRVWRSGPHRVRRVAWGYRLIVPGKLPERQYDSAWTEEDAQKQLAARLLELPRPTSPAPGVTFGVMADKYLAEKQAEGKRSIRNDRQAIARLKVALGVETPLAEITAGRIRDYTVARLEMISRRLGRKVQPATVNK